MEKMVLPDIVRSICETAKAIGGAAYPVGGSVRDHVLGIHPKDFDIEVYQISLDRLIQMLEALSLPLDLVGKSFGIIKIKGEDIDISIPRRDSKVSDGHRGFVCHGDPTMTPQEAASRRDYTINSLSYNPYEEIIIDPCGGCYDLRNKILRHTSDAFSEDPLRVLRGMQFIARFDLTADPMTIKLCRDLTIDELSPERIRDEWFKLITKGVVISKGLKFLVDTGWIRFFPELDALRGVQQDPQWHPEGDVFEHTCQVMDAFALTRGEEPEIDQLLAGFGSLCHDFGKPATTEFRDGRWRSAKHEMGGKGPTRDFLGRLILRENQKSNSEFIEQVVSLVTNHMAPTVLAEIGGSDSAIRRLSTRVGRIDLLAWVSQCDKMGRGDTPYNGVAEDWLRRRAKEVAVLDSKPKPILMGRHLIADGYAPGLLFKEILDSAYEDQLEGMFSDEDGAIEWLRENGPLYEDAK